MIYLLLYMDDIVLTASSMPLLRRTITALQQEFSLKDLGPLHHFLGMHVQQSASGITLSQRQFMIEIERSGMSDCKPCTTPVDINPNSQLMVTLSQIPRNFTVLQAHYSTSLSPVQILRMLFNKSVSTCTILGNPIWQPSSVSCGMSEALFSWAFTSAPLRR